MPNKYSTVGTSTQVQSSEEAMLKLQKEYPLTPPRLSTNVPKFTVGELKACIPRHCFERSLVTSFGHLAHDLILAALIFKAGTYIGHPSFPEWTSYILWPLFWYA
jgi:omega-6 fatty acid desaturase (delta-12 desaturase)